MFEDRQDAARRLAEALRTRVGPRPLVLAIPRGAAPLGRIVADALGGDLDVVLVRKLGAPFNPELAVGAIDESGWTYLTDFARAAGADDAYVAGERRRQLARLAERRALYSPHRAAISPSGRECIVVDDGLATGATMIAALHAVRSSAPRRLVCAVPVASRSALAAVRGLADEVVCLHAPEDFGAVGLYYRRFDQVEDEEVAACLAPAREPAP